MSDDMTTLPGENDEVLEKAETFLGGLRSELDEGSHLHPAFASLAAASDSVRASYLSFSITPERAAQAFQLLRLVDDNDIEWTVGPSSGSWYRRRIGSKSWQAGPAPLMAEPQAGQGEPWLSSEISELLPSGRSSIAAGAGTVTNQAGIRVVDALQSSPEAEKESTDWLLAEWDSLENELQNLQAGARSTVSIEDSAAWPVKQMFEKHAKVEPVVADLENVGLPDRGVIDDEPISGILDLFVRPQAPAPRSGSADVADVLDQGPVVRNESSPSNPTSGSPMSALDVGITLKDPIPSGSAGTPNQFMAEDVSHPLTPSIPSLVTSGSGQDINSDHSEASEATPGLSNNAVDAVDISPESRPGADSSDDDPYGLGR